MHDVRRHIASCLKFMALTACFHIAAPAVAQELNAKVTINRSQISNTTDAVFEALQNSLTAFINERQWTGMTYEEEERINCTFSITLKTYSETDNSFTGSIQVQSTRPVYDSNYSTTVFNFQDENFNFTFQQFDQLEFRPEQVDNNLTAVIAYYAYLIIGMDMDTMAPLGGSDILQMAIEMLKQARDQKSMSALPVIFTDIKRDELVSIYSGKGTAEEREKVYNIVFAINASQSNYWEKLRK